MTGKDNEFIVHLNIEYVYSAILTHISKNVENYFNNTKVGTLAHDDLCSILRNLVPSSFYQDLGVSLAIQWGKIIFCLSLIYQSITTNRKIKFH